MTIRNESVERTFGHIEVVIYFFEEGGEQRAMGDVAYTDPGTGIEYTGSLDRLLMTHTLEDMDTGEEVTISRRRVEEIEDWADEEGY